MSTISNELFLLNELEKKYSFHSGSDCEILLPLYKEMGLDFFRELDAEFALVMYDADKDQIVAGRDPIGIRPLFYGYLMGTKEIAFASEAKALIDICDDVQAFPPGHYYFDGEFVCYRDMTKTTDFVDGTVDEIIVGIREKLELGIQKRLDWIQNLNIIEEFKSIVDSNIERIGLTNEQFSHRISAQKVGIDARDIFKDSSFTTKMPENSVPLIITSPPYGSAQKYIRSTSQSLNWLGFTPPQGLRSLEEKSIGREHLISEPLCLDMGDLPKNYKCLIEKIAQTNKTRARITQKYLIEMEQVAKELSRILTVNGRIILVLGNNQVCGETLRNDEFMIYCFKKYGLNLKLVLVDDIKSRGLMTKRNRTASVISREIVLVFEKLG